MAARSITRQSLEKPWTTVKLFDDEMPIYANGFRRFEFVPLDTNGEKYRLSVIIDEKLFTGDVEIGYQGSEYIDTSDLLKVFCGVSNLDQFTSLSFQTEICENVLNISVCVCYQKDRKKKRREEKFNFKLHEVERDIEQEDANIIRKSVDKLEIEREQLNKKLRIIEGFYDYRIKQLDMKFYFSVTQTININCSEIIIHIHEDNKEFIRFIIGHSRFRTISGHFKKNVHETKINFISRDLYEKNCDNICEWIIDTNTGADVGYSFTHRTPDQIIEYIRKRDVSDYNDQRKQVDTILLALFECNLEFELYEKLLLPPVMHVPLIQYIESPGFNHEFNILAKLSNLPKFNDETFFHPSIGFYKSEIEHCFSIE
jgi:hypothetical protein